ncbi:hypothetical protein ASPZODRAFT_140256 [Penicilliopsis zonata CBS 506.65]|uniref:STAS domain-containing protein n=1 Tax=Penicilliopsis zonata CBS 506.65 TaxID=1073090 RepID=A0A1L9SQJ1_9EURO|nr:hypothetical protein ASPZODRAFT_140256 [Penicilliopsis zonata CBS 506.65]OJJ49351.1 hypothetical protein ASPZODRAFT_140256 [Penicilliopsis zonata CBS 506.65]
MGILSPRGGSDSHPPSRWRHRASFTSTGHDAEDITSSPDLPVEEQSNIDTSSRVEPVATFGGSSWRTPGRSYFHGSFRQSPDIAQYSSQGLREQTAELASFALSLNGKASPVSAGPLPPRLDIFRPDQQSIGKVSDAGESSEPWPIAGATGAESLTGPLTGTSALTEMIRKPSDESLNAEVQKHGSYDPGSEAHVLPSEEEAEEEAVGERGEEVNEQTLLLPKKAVHSADTSRNYGLTAEDDVECQAPSHKRKTPTTLMKVATCARLVSNPKAWDRRSIWQHGVMYPISLVPAVLLGLLLNVLDALSYGMILFPIGEPLFADLGSDGISMFYVSCVISQLVFSCGGSIFKGGIGSEMIEVVPFFHKMAFTILATVGEDNPRAVLATTILAFSASSVLTGLVFFLMGTCRLGSLIGFFPRHILIGCIGGVGWFLIATGIEVSARLPGSLEYTLPTVQRLFALDTFPLWTIPLGLAVGLLVLKRFVHSNFLVGLYFIAVAVVFFCVKFVAKIPMDTLRESGWVFAAPSSSNPWYHFYTLYDFSVVDWQALLDTVPAMFALTFFGVLHVPINVPALGISTGEDNLSVDRELIAHGVTNALSGFAGSIQNYLVYTNSLLFIDSGGNSRLAGIMLAGATAGILVMGPAIVGFIPVMVVGALIFMLGIELMEEALVDTWGKLHRLEYLTVVIIVVTMGAWDFVVGIVVGIILACVNFVVQTSQKPAIRATYSGQIARSTVRRPPIQQQYLNEAGQQTLVLKLAGYLFFGTIVKVETTMRGLIEEEAFDKRPIRFLILDFSHVYGIDFSAAEAFTRINRILRKRNVQVAISGLDVGGEVGRSLQNVGLIHPSHGVVDIFEDLNSALEFCENEYLKVFYSRRETFLKDGRPSTTTTVQVPVHPSSSSSSAAAAAAAAAQISTADFLVSSPRRRYLQQVATTTLRDADTAAVTIPPAWSAMRQPLPLLLQTFQGLTTRNEDFWFPLCAYLTQQTFPSGTVLYHEGEVPQAFYLLESGMLRAEYDTPQGRYFERIVAGGPCGELPFFSATRRTATVKAEQDCHVWALGAAQWEALREAEPLIARELLTVSLKLTSERMESITS